MSMFDDPRPYAVFRYVLDANGEPTEHAGQVVAFVKSTDPWQAVEDAGFDDMNLYGANMVDPETYDKIQKSIEEERQLLDKVEGQLKEFIAERDAEIEKIREERECPNGCGKMDEQFRCKKCGFGFEIEQAVIPELEKEIAEKQANGEDTTELEKTLEELKKSLEE